LFTPLKNKQNPEMNKTISPADEQNSTSFQVPGFVHSVLWRRPGARGQSHRKSLRSAQDSGAGFAV